VKQAYIAALTAQRTLALRRSILEKQNALLRQFQTIFDLKQASTIDLLNAQVNARSAALDVKSSEHDLSLALQRLGNTIGYPRDRKFQIAEIGQPDLPASTLDAAIGIGLKNRVDIAQVTLNRKSSEIDLILAKASAMPGLGLSGGLNMSIPGGSLSPAASSATVGLKIAMPILDAGSARGQVNAAAAQLGVYDAQIAQLQKSIAADIRDAFESVQIQADRVDLAKQNMDLFDARFEVAKAQNASGTMSNQDLFSASVDAANADVSYANAQNTYLLSVVQLQTAMGL
jgi:outer membrane protein TolC